MATPDSLKKVITIIQADPHVEFIVVSAPGKRMKGDIKVTDLLYALAEEVKQKGTYEGFTLIEERFLPLAQSLNLKEDFLPILNQTLSEIKEEKTLPFIVSRGEYLSARLLALALNYTFVDAEYLLRFRGVNLDHGQTNQQTKSVLKGKTKVVIPGFYGATPGGEVRLLPRGGSDLTGALIARAVKAKMYENWTDVDGFLICDPTIVDKPKIIETMTYR
jgi:aspartate kinase